MHNRILARGFDIAVAGTVAVFLAPLFFVVALVVKLDSDGPVFLQQKWVGRQNCMFDVYKFRSMRKAQCDDRGERSATRDNDCITRVARILRMTSMDEPRQRSTVLKGNVLIVGPRLHAVHSTAKSKHLREVDPRY